MLYDKELDQVKAWMDIRIQLYEHFLFTGTRRFNLPTFEEFIRYDMNKPIWFEGSRGMNCHCGTRYYTK